MLDWIGFALIWLLHFLPLRVLAAIGMCAGMILYALDIRRRRIVRLHLRLCFPKLSGRERERIVRRHYCALVRSLLERGIVWWWSKEHIQNVVKIEGLEYADLKKQHPTIWLAPHFIGLEIAAIRLSAEFSGVCLFAQHKRARFETILLRRRTRFVTSRAVRWKNGLRTVIKAMHEGLPLYYGPDVDRGPRRAVFVSFFGVQSATATSLSRIARITGARVVPCVSRQLPGSAGYCVQFYPEWQGFPSYDLAADTRRMNAFIEQRVMEMPEQYQWFHKRFNTRPPGGHLVYK